MSRRAAGAPPRKPAVCAPKAHRQDVNDTLGAKELHPEQPETGQPRMAHPPAVSASKTLSSKDQSCGGHPSADQAHRSPSPEGQSPEGHSPDAQPRGGTLREGFTTGSAAAAAARAATLFALTGVVPQSVDIPLPPPHQGARLTIAIADAADDGLGVRAGVVKDGGDDPDATHGARIEAHVTLDPAFSGVGPHVLIGGGKGVGTVTLPGLPVAVGQAAINPGPMAQIRQSVLEVLPEDFKGIALVVIEAPEGEAMARHTLNPRLGIIGGISILGTGGIVRPYSHGAWAECVRRSLDVARAAGHACAVLTTGRRSERFFQERFPFTPDVCLAQAADFFAQSMQDAARRGFTCVVWAVFFGKLVKQAQGFASTHAREVELDFALLAEWAREAGADEAQASAVAQANTAAQALALLPGAVAARLTALLVTQAKAAARRHITAAQAGQGAGADLSGGDLSREDLSGSDSSDRVSAERAAGSAVAENAATGAGSSCAAGGSGARSALPAAERAEANAESAAQDGLHPAQVGRSGAVAEVGAATTLDVRYVVFGLEGGVLYEDDVPEALFSPVFPLHPGAGSR
ncbi:hypothetical protein JCM14124_04520 [Humidesulfovibrio idahonensis]